MVKKKKLNLKKNKCYVSLVENMLYFLVPFLIALGDIDLSIVSLSCLMAYRFTLVMKHREAYSKWELFKEVFNRVTWILMNLIYLGYYFIEKFYGEVLPI